MTEFKVIQRPRQSGKTLDIMEEIAQYVILGRGPEVLIIVNNIELVSAFTATWRNRYSALRLPDIMTLGNVLKARGRRYSKVYVEDIEMSPFGIYDEKIQDVLPSLAWSDDAEVIFTSSEYPPFPKPPSQREVDAERRRRARANRKALEEQVMIATMMRPLPQSVERRLLLGTQESNDTTA